MKKFSLSQIFFLIFVVEQISGYYMIQRKRNFIVNTFCPLPGGIFSYPGDCNLFVTCTYSRGCIMNCPKGLHFSPHHRVCTTPEQSRCKTDPINKHLVPPPHCSRGYQAIALPETVSDDVYVPEQQTSRPQVAIHFPTSRPELSTAPPQEILFPAEGQQSTGGFHEIIFPDVAPTGLPDGSQVGAVDGFTDGASQGGASHGTAINFGGSSMEDSLEGSDEDSEERPEASFEDWENWIDWFNENRHSAPVFTAVRQSFPDPRTRYSSRKRKTNRYSKSPYNHYRYY